MKTKTYKSTLKRGQIVPIYEKPITKEHQEGVGKLHKHEGYGCESYYPEGSEGPERKLELWSVFINNEKRVVDRWVSPDDVYQAVTA